MTAEATARRLLRTRSGGLCEGCARAEASEWAHRVRRNVGPWCPTNGLDLCRACHSWAHLHPRGARLKGWLLRATDDPGLEPVFMARWGYVLLTHDGGLIEAVTTTDTRRTA